MGYLHVIKPLGVGPGLHQSDHAAKLASGVTGVTYGTLLKLNTSGEWVKGGTADDADPTTTPLAPLFFISTMDQSTSADAQASGDVGDGSIENTATTGDIETDIGIGWGSRAGKITALQLSNGYVVETDQYVGTPAIGSYLGVGTGADAGKATAHASADHAIGYVIAGARSIFDNSATAISGWRTGGSTTVLRYLGLHIPNLVTA